MERSAAMWLVGGGVALALVVGVGLAMRESGEGDGAAPPLSSEAVGALVSAPPEQATPPADTRVPGEHPTEVPAGAWRELPSGARVADLVVGEGDPVIPGATVVVDYTGWLSEGGTLFDSSKRRARPLIFGMDEPPIPGWADAVVDMRVGGRRQVVLPPALAYGQTGLPPRVPRDATIVFEFELQRVVAPRVAPEHPPAVAAGALRELEPGLQAAEVTVGEGRAVQPGDAVELDYTGWLASGRRFDSSLTRPVPAAFVWGQGEMLPGVERGLTGMKVGGKRLLVVGPDLAYGARGRRGFVPPNETLTFLVEVVSAAPR